ncbi:hypothetical protein [Streptomyces sp. AcH 505]|uniref:hypothetical protein n=1 Tax=Streptomyces sp. AcH 505 TaxID=352211 RepID=UPI0007C672B7
MARRKAVARRAVHRLRVPLIATAVVVPLYAVWAVLLATGGGDLAAQFAWAGFMRRHPATPYDLSWYGGTHTANYSVLAPALMAVLGVKAVSVAAGLAGSWGMALLFVRAGVRRPLWPAVLAALVLWCNVASGRTTFALGVAIGLFTLLYVRRTVLAVLLATLTAAASPVAGLFLVVAGAAYLLDRRWTQAAVLVVPPAFVVGTVSVLFPFQGEQPMGPGKLVMPLIACAALGLTAPRTWRLVRFGTAVYAAGVVLTYAVTSPIGTNVERLVGLAGPPLLLAALLTRGVSRAHFMSFVRSPSLRRAVPRAVLVAAVLVNTGWVINKTDDDLRVSNTVPAWAERSAGVAAALRRLGAERTRVEVVPARDHREAAILAPHINMARGWNRQLDVVRGRVFYEGPLTAETYRGWLDRWAVGLVVLPHGTPDGPAEAEATVVRSEPDWLEPVWQDSGWTVYRVRDAVPLVSPPGSVARSSEADLLVRMPVAGSVTVRIAYSPWLRAKGACVARDGHWTRLTVPEAGDYRLSSTYRLPRDGGCTAKPPRATAWTTATLTRPAL